MCPILDMGLGRWAQPGWFRGGGVWLTGQCSLVFSAPQLRQGQETICLCIPCAQESNDLTLLRL